MLPSKSKWNFNDQLNITDNWKDISNEISPVTKELLLQRGITTSEQAKEFLNPSLERLHDPILLTDIEKASNRVQEAIENNEKILIFGDYDADGVSSTTLLLSALRELGADCDFYIPNRFTEGYGPNEKAFEQAHHEGVGLIITVDTGIAALHEAKVAKNLGIDLIITDHHEVQDEVPDAYSVIHPKYSLDYPFKELAGVGVAFKFAQYLLGYLPKHLLDLVAIGTIADLVPLIDENRILAYYGLKKLATTNRPGLKALMKLANINGDVTEETVGFTIGPRLNAVGRLQDADLAVHLLTTSDEQEAEQLAEIVDSLNQERQQIVDSIVQEVDSMMNVDEKDGIIIVAKEGWNEGVLGIVASRLVRKYDRPAIVLAINEEAQTAKGSARSIPAFDLFNNCMRVRSLFTHFGGHSQAAGMTLPLENVQTLQEELNELILSQLSRDDFKQELSISKTIGIKEINEELIEEVNQLAPFGMANPKPLFHISSIPNDARQLGTEKKHLKLQFKQDDAQLEGIGFGMGNLYPYLSPDTSVSVVGSLGINEWNGFRKPQMIMEDLKINEWQLFDHRGKTVDIAKYFSVFKHHTVLGGKRFNEYKDRAHVITYDTPVDEIEPSDVLYIMELPTDLEHLQRIVHKIQPNNIHTCFHLDHSMYLSSFPTREDFKWFYGILMKRKKLDLKQEMNMVMKAKNWSKDHVLFISKVFFELGFVMIDNGVVQLNPAPMKKDLQDSPLYQQRLNQVHIEKVLYYSTFDKLKNWLQDAMGHTRRPKEEVVNGL